MRARLRHGLYYVANVATIGPILLLDLGGKLATRMDWTMFNLQLWAYRDKRSLARKPGQ